VSFESCGKGEVEIVVYETARTGTDYLPPGLSRCTRTVSVRDGKTRWETELAGGHL
jgi:hypothetical protein